MLQSPGQSCSFSVSQLIVSEAAVG